MENDKMTLEEVIEKLYDFSETSEEDRKQIIAESAEMISEAALLNALNESSGEIQGEFEVLIAGEPEESAVMEFVEKNIPNFDNYLVAEIEVFQKMSMEQDAKEENGEG